MNKKIILLVFAIITICIAGVIIFINKNEEYNNNLPDEKCLRAGERWPGECCEGLRGVGPTGTCLKKRSKSIPWGGLLICAPCGNGICEKKYSESVCSCPDDCNKNDNCVSAGGNADEYIFGKYKGQSNCCDGLKKIPKTYEDNKCYDSNDEKDICSDCGNSICESWENKCNCPEDCK